jgi:hypothetical protein
MVYFLYDNPPAIPAGYEELGMTRSNEGLIFDESLMSFKNANDPANTRPTA